MGALTVSGASAEAGAGLSLLREVLGALAVDPPRSPDEELSSELDDEPPDCADPLPADSPALDDSARDPRDPPRDAELFAGALLEAEDSDPDEPADPVVSAKAIGIAANADPTPRASARAPTRPT